MQLEKVMIPIKSLGIELEAYYYSHWRDENTFQVCASGEWAAISTPYFETKEEALAEAIKEAEEVAADFLDVLRSKTDTVDNAFKTILLNNVVTYTAFDESVGEKYIHDDLFTIAMACYKKVLEEVLPF